MSVKLIGDLVGIHSCDYIEATYNAQALTTIDVAIISQRALMAVAKQHSEIAMALWCETLVDASIAREWLLNVGRRSSHQRIAHLICEIHCRRSEAGLANVASKTWPMTQEQIGDATGLTPVHVNRIINKLRRSKLIEGSNRQITIADWKGLQRAGDFNDSYMQSVSAFAA